MSNDILSSKAPVAAEGHSQEPDESSGKHNENKQEAPHLLQLLQAAKLGHSHTIEQIIEKCFNKGKDDIKRAVNCRDKDKLGPLHHAVRHNHLEAVKVLIDNHAVVNQVTSQDVTPLHIATKYIHGNDENDQIKPVKGVITYLVKKGADCTAKDSYGSTPLHFAAMRGNKHAAEELINAAGERIFSKISTLIKARDKQGMTPLHEACLHRNESVAILLLEHHADHLASDCERRTPLHLACLSGSHKICQAIIDNITKKRDKIINMADIAGKTPLENAVHSGKKEVVKFCIDKGAKIPDPKHNPAARKRLIREASLSNSWKEIMEELVKKEQMAEQETMLKREVVQIAAANGRHKIIELLIYRGKSEGNNGKITGKEVDTELINHTDEELRTPLLIAAGNGYHETVEYLLKVEADLEATDKHGKTALFLAAENNHEKVVMVLLKMLKEKSERNRCEEESETKVDRRETDIHVLDEIEVSDQLPDDNAQDENKKKDVKHTEGERQIEDPELTEGVSEKRNSPERKKAKWLSMPRFGKRRQGPKGNDWAFQEKSKQPLDILNHSDNYGNTPLHIASQHGQNEIVEQLIKAGAELKTTNFEENTPLHLAAANGRDSIVMELIKYDRPKSLDKNNDDERKDEDKHHDEIHNDSQDEGQTADGKSINKLEEVPVTKDVSARNDVMNTPLHLAARGGHTRIVELLIDNGAEVMAMNDILYTPLDYAASRGWKKTVEVLLKRKECHIDPLDKTKNTPLHLASANGHSKVVETLLNRGANIMKCNMNNQNCLDLAIENNHRETALVIIRHRKWKDAMCNVHRGKASDEYDTPMRKLIRKMPDVATEVLNRCISENKKDRTDHGYRITFDFAFIDDTFCNFKEYKDDKTKDVVSPFEDPRDGTLKASAKPYTTNHTILKKNHPLTLMVKHERSSLLGHPIVKSLIRHKWNAYSRHVYYTGMVIYLFFVLLLTGYLLSTPPPYYFREDNGTTVWYANGEDKYGQEAENYIRPNFTILCKWLVFVLGILGIIKEIFQAYMRRSDYLSVENIMEWFIYLLSVLFVFDFDSDQHLSGLRYQWQWCFGTFAIFFAWMEMIIFIRKVAYVGTFVVMFIDMLRTFGRFSLILMLFLLAFSLSFYALLMNQSTFSSFGYALMKTFVMLTGEFDYDEIFHGIGYLDKDEFDEESHDYFEEMVWYEGVTYIIFALFIVIAAILIMNLLIGLAVDDIKGVQGQAELKNNALQIEFALDVEQMLPLQIRKKYYRRTTTIKPNKPQKSEFFSGMRSSISTQAIAKSLNPDKSKLDRLQESHHDMQDSIKKLKGDIQSKFDLLQDSIKKLKGDTQEKGMHLTSEHQEISSERTDILQDLNDRIEKQGKSIEEQKSQLSIIEQQNNRIESMLEALLPNKSDV